MESKIFINTDDEIAFIAEKIKLAKEDRIALVVPDKALIFSSLPSLKLLKRLVDKYKKKLVLVTMDDSGRKLTEAAKISTVGRITELNADIWKNMDMDETTPVHHEEKLQPEVEETADDSAEIIEHEEIQPETPIAEQIQPLVFKEEALSAEIEESNEDISTEEMLKEGDKIESSVHFDTAKEENLQSETPQPTKAIIDKEKEPEVEFVFGKDINEIGIIPENNKAKRPKGKHNELSTDAVVPLTDKNYARMSKSMPIPARLAASFAPIINIFKRNWKKINFKSGSNKKLLIPAVILLILLLGTTVYAYWAAPKATINLEAKKIDIKQDKEIFVSDKQTSVTTVDNKIYIPSNDITSEPQTASADAPSTGVKKTGTSAIGKIEITNVSTTRDINIKKGSSLFVCRTGTCINLVYISQDNATIPKRSSGQLPAFADVNVTANDIGETYNFNFPSQNIFDLTGAENDTVSKSINSFTGGTSKEIKVVAASDVDALRKQLNDQLKSNAIANLRSSTGAENILIESTITTKTSEEKLDSAIGQQADRVNLSLSLVGTAKGFKKNDLQSISNDFVKTQSKNGYKIDDSSIVYTPQIKDKVGNDQRVVLTISGTLNPDLDSSKIKDALNGKSLNDAKKYLEGMDSTQKVDILYSPPWVPGFLQHIPFTNSAINLNIKIQ